MEALALVVLKKKIFHVFPIIHYTPMIDKDIPGRGLYGPKGHGWYDLYKGPPYIATHKI